MFKLIGKIIGIVLAVACFLFTLYFFFGNNGYGVEAIQDLFSDGFLNGLKDFFVSIWDGFKHVVGL